MMDTTLARLEQIICVTVYRGNSGVISKFAKLHYLLC